MQLHKDITKASVINFYNTLESKFNKIHTNKYNYSEFEYKKSSIKSTIICPIHGRFMQRANNHLLGQGCSKCSRIRAGLKRRNNTEEMIIQAKKVHNNKYDYSKFVYVGWGKKSTIICPIHGEWETIMGTHLNGVECPECGIVKGAESRKHNIEDLIKKANKIHKNKYDYSEFNYTLIGVKSTIVCPIHGKFNTSMAYHVNDRSGCPKCSGRSTDNDSLYMWKIKDTNVYKIGITSHRLGHKRINRVANEHKVKPIILAFVEIKDALALEIKLHKMFNSPQFLIVGGDGHSEFMTLNHNEVIEILDCIKAEMINGELSYPI